MLATMSLDFTEIILRQLDFLAWLFCLAFCFAHLLALRCLICFTCFALFALFSDQILASLLALDSSACLLFAWLLLACFCFAFCFDLWFALRFAFCLLYFALLYFA
jgi:hypothetical protein